MNNSEFASLIQTWSKSSSSKTIGEHLIAEAWAAYITLFKSTEQPTLEKLKDYFTQYTKSMQGAAPSLRHKYLEATGTSLPRDTEFRKILDRIHQCVAPKAKTATSS